MKRQRHLTIVCIILLFLAFVIFLLGRTGILGAPSVLQPLFTPFQKLLITVRPSQSSDMLKEENANLRKQLVDQEQLKREVSALRDQFETQVSSELRLLPAQVIGAPGFIPGVSTPEYLILDKGTNDGVVKGQAVVIKDNLVGTIDTVTATVAKVVLVSQKNTSFTAKDMQTNAAGIVRGDGTDALVFENVLPSEKLVVKDTIVTRGDVDEKGNGLVPNLIVGKVVSVDKEASALFQKAQVKSLVSFERLTTVFIVLGTK